MGNVRPIFRYKLDEQGKRLIKTGGCLPSSGTRSACGAKNGELPLPERTHACGCGNALDRDINAPINIKNEALRMQPENKSGQPWDTRVWLVECLRR
ncbi:MAG: transposase [Clostridiales bacterium]|nr:transposase [Clostridiales bacterium]